MIPPEHPKNQVLHDTSFQRLPQTLTAPTGWVDCPARQGSKALRSQPSGCGWDRKSILSNRASPNAHVEMIELLPLVVGDAADPSPEHIGGLNAREGGERVVYVVLGCGQVSVHPHLY
jgi:hypothetical protein